MKPLDSKTGALFTGRRAVVTGGCGFVGAHLVKTLVHSGCEVTVIDDCSSATTENLEQLGVLSRVQFIRHEISSKTLPSYIVRALDRSDYLFHLAAAKSNQAVDPARILDQNLVGTFELFDQAKRSGVKKIVFSSSVYVYGTYSQGPFGEDHPLHPDTAYGASKLLAEKYLAALSCDGKIRATSLRYFFVYGPNQYCGLGRPSVILRSLDRIARGEGLELTGDGSQVFDYVYVEDVVRATMMAVAPEADGKVYNVGSGESYSIARLLSTISRFAKNPLSTICSAPDETQATRRTAKIELIERDLGWRPAVSLAAGLRETVEWFLRHRAAGARAKFSL